MKVRKAILTAVLAALSVAPSPAPIAPNNQVAELAGRAPGKPQRCVSGQSKLVFQTADADPHLLLYDDGKTIWASRLSPSCGFEAGQTAMPEDSASYYCRGDFVRARNRISLLPFGRTCALGEFTPYRSAK